jgi:subtilisin family serine protease
MRLALPLVAILACCLVPVAGRSASGPSLPVDQTAPATGSIGSDDTPAPLDPVDQKLESRLRRLREDRPRGPLRGGPGRRDAWWRGDDVRVLVRLEVLDDAARAALAGAGLRVLRESPERGLIEGWVASGGLRGLAALDGVRSVRPADRGETRIGRVTSGGDTTTMGAATARAQFGVDGSGVRVGVVSDGIDGAAASRATGDLPPDGPVVPSGCEAGSGSEGTAMLEIVHDLAPGASLLFASGVDSPVAFMKAVQCLTTAGANVIVDDLGFFGEPYFQDGDLARTAREAVQAGVSYHSAAGNSAMAHYEAPFRAVPGSKLHDFGDGGSVDDRNVVTVPSGGSLLCVLQWDEPFGAAGDDYNLLLVDEKGAIITRGDNVQNGDDDPLEIVSAHNDGGGVQVAGLKIERARGSAHMLELFCVRDVDTMEHVTPTSSIFGHAAVAEVVAVGAIDVGDPGLDTIERFSSEGPVRLAFPPTTRPKPDLAAFDGIATAVPGFSPFFGTSAAVPHVAAIAALMLQRNPFLTPAEIQATLAATAVDIGPPGFDDAAGAGRVDAVAALAAVAPPECPPESACNDGNPCTTDRCERGRCIHAPVSCDDGNPCNGAETCQPETGACAPGMQAPDGTPCPDSTVCNGEEICHAGICTPGTPLVCSDGDTCTQDLCSPEAGCQFPQLESLASVSCILERGLPSCPGVNLPASVRERFLRAQRLIARGEAAQSRRTQRRLVKQAARVLRRAAAAVERARRLPPDCMSAVASSLGDARNRARLVAQGLR